MSPARKVEPDRSADSASGFKIGKVFRGGERRSDKNGGGKKPKAGRGKKSDKKRGGKPKKHGKRR